jgi:hypothetical protein
MSAFTVFFMRISLPCEPAIDMARRSCPLEGFEQCDTVLDGLNDLNRRSLVLVDSWDPLSSICLVNHKVLNIASGLLTARKLTRFCPGYCDVARGIINAVFDQTTRNTMQAFCELLRSRGTCSASRVRAKHSRASIRLDARHP